jgi:hypothetical protein
MLSRKFIFACAAAVATIGVAITPVTASAKSSGNGGSHQSQKHKPGKHAHHKHHHHKHHKHAHHHHHKHKHHKHRWHYYYKYYPVQEVETSYVSRPNYVVTPSTSQSCTCLTKEYTPDGSVLFRDVCTKEMAVNSVGSKKAAAADND